MIFTVFTDSVEMYRSRLEELTSDRGPFTLVEAAKAHTGSLERQSVDHFKELTYLDRRAIHNLKYYTWVEQQGKTYEGDQRSVEPRVLAGALRGRGRPLQSAHRRLQPRGRMGVGLGRLTQQARTPPERSGHVSANLDPQRHPGHLRRSMPGP